MIFYTYLWLREDGTPYYAGKGHGRRAFVMQGHCVRPPKDVERVLVQEFPSEAAAFSAEKFLIAFYGRIHNGTGCLRNRTDGGEGPAGMTHSASTKHIMSIRKKGIPKSAETRKNMTAAQRLRFENSSMTPEHRKRMSAAAKVRIARDGGKHVRAAGLAGAKARWHKKESL